MKLFIKPHNETAWEFYRNHGHFHGGDAGLDLYVLEDIQFEPNETKAIKLGISCEPEDGKAYYLFPRSSISKTPLRMANSIGLIDGGYRGEIIAMCDNIKSEPFQLVYVSPSVKEPIDNMIVGIFIYKVNHDYQPPYL